MVIYHWISSSNTDKYRLQLFDLTLRSEYFITATLEILGTFRKVICYDKTQYFQVGSFFLLLNVNNFVRELMDIFVNIYGNVVINLKSAKSQILVTCFEWIFIWEIYGLQNWIGHGGSIQQKKYHISISPIKERWSKSQ